MLTVRTYLGPSKIHGIGIFANEDIPAGMTVWTFHPLIDQAFNHKEWSELKAKLSEACFEQIESFIYKEDGRYILCGDNARFMNHSEDCNLSEDKTTGNNLAARVIRKGEELTCNYADFCDPDDPNLKIVRSKTF